MRKFTKEEEHEMCIEILCELDRWKTHLPPVQWELLIRRLTHDDDYAEAVVKYQKEKGWIKNE